MSDNTDASVSQGNGSSNASATIQDRTRGIVLALFVGINLAGTLGMFAQWRIAEREERMLQYYLLELDAKFIAAGLKKPEDSIAKHLGERK